MKFRLTVVTLTLILAVFFMAGTSFADSLSLTDIGSLSTGGQKYPEWWYTLTNPTLKGTADNGDDVTLKIGDKIYDATANVEGKWEITLALEKGDYKMELASGSSKYNFTLHLGQDYTATSTTTQTSSSTASVPSTGGEQTTALTLGLGVSLLALYLYFFDANKKHKVFEKNIVSDQ